MGWSNCFKDLPIHCNTTTGAEMPDQAVWYAKNMRKWEGPIKMCHAKRRPVRQHHSQSWALVPARSDRWRHMPTGGSQKGFT